LTLARRTSYTPHNEKANEERHMSVLIKGGRIITAADDYVGDVYIEDERISLLGSSLDVSADKVIDATGKIVMPGAIDPHTHIEMFFGGTTTCDDFTSGTTAAAFGGTTTLIDFCVQTPGDTFAQALEKYHEKIDRCPPLIDVGFHIAVTDLHTGGTLEDLAKLPGEGVTSYKLFMAYKGAVMVDDDTLFRVMQTAHETGGLVMVHAENGDAIDIIVKETVAAGKTDPVWHARSRPMETEAEATNRAIQLARIADAPLYVVHVSCQPAVEPIALAREKGWKVPVLLRRRVDDGGPELGGGEVHLHAAAPAQGAPGAPLEGDPDRCAVGRVDRSLPVQLARAEGDQRPRVPGRPERWAGDREPLAHAVDVRRR
jgi:dihydropyrimidinase